MRSMKSYKPVLICTDGGEVLIGQLEQWTGRSLVWGANDSFVGGYEYERQEWELKQVTHWMPLPEPPKEES